jgi:hydrogenase maturation protein HypF
VLALGAGLKNTICVTRGDEAFLSQHVGGLDNPAACRMQDEVTRHLLDILEVQPEAVAHDLHPDFFGTRRALEIAQTLAVPAVAVQHHHAHIAAVTAEHGVTGPVLGLALDGVGLGDDGMAWGGELLRVDGAAFTRLGHLAPLPLPGGDRAAREPWRMASAVLYRMGHDDEIGRRFGAQGGQLLQILERRLNCPETTSLGRWFDAATGLLGVRATMAYEGQAAMELEGLAERHGAVAPLRDGWRIEDRKLDLLPLLAQLADETNAARGAALFHATLTEALADWLSDATQEQDIDTVALGGGCFLNHILSRTLRSKLQAHGLTVLEARRAPPNDGGLSLGQAWVAIQSLEGSHACV